uniref:Uncharacterized protein n=1 Tax=Zea mays TaxID=4577 RepID=A0A804LCE1_MAIZE
MNKTGHFSLHKTFQFIELTQIIQYFSSPLSLDPSRWASRDGRGADRRRRIRTGSGQRPANRAWPAAAADRDGERPGQEKELTAPDCYRPGTWKTKKRSGREGRVRTGGFRE